LQFRNRGNELVVENTGHVIEVPLPANSANTLKIGKSVYTLTQYHFHAPASTRSTGAITT
jgi:carbonic anhydrase